MFRNHIIWGNYPETAYLIKQLQLQYEFDLITLIDDEVPQNIVKAQGAITYAGKEFVENTRMSEVTEFHYYYTPPSRRKGGPAWKVKNVIGLIHEFQTDKKRRRYKRH
ncbi:hypothetical protein [Sporosarcina luteola]|uniref:hypothetical protein n=1 Tax=Sporosarcina luteola TaxID=582850 RepID=UPI00203F6762|nr:hypothetical protein [Sporosarcina luteola]MCM3709207.1 hypothetical protein [Sporosarcina luteola]